VERIHAILKDTHNQLLITIIHVKKLMKQMPLEQQQKTEIKNKSKKLTQIGVAPLSRPRYVQQSRGGSTWQDSSLSATRPLRYTIPDTYNTPEPVLNQSHSVHRTMLHTQHDTMNKI